MDPKIQTRRTIDQEIAELEAKLAQKRERRRQLDNGQKYVIGGTLLALARKNDADRKYLLDMLEKHVTRPADVRRIRPIIAELKGTTTAEGTSGKTATTPARPGTFEVRPDTRNI